MDRQLEGDIDLETAARLLGVHYQTAYRWVRTGFLPAVKVGSGYRLAAADVAEVAAGREVPRPLAYTGRGRDWDRLREQLHTALVAGDDTGARRVFEMVHLARVPILDQCEQLLAPNLRRVGEEWEAGELSGARVRVAAGICERSLDWAVGRLATAPGDRAVALVVTPKDDEHRLPSLMAGAVLRDRGWAVREIQGVSPSEILDLADRMHPALAVVSVTVGEAVGTAEELRWEIEARGVPVLVGGPGKSLRDVALRAAEPAAQA
jgi:MerR family transcriptional regulator, light-induced transcriptional regulator